MGVTDRNLPVYRSRFSLSSPLVHELIRDFHINFNVKINFYPHQKLIIIVKILFLVILNFIKTSITRNTNN